MYLLIYEDGQAAYKDMLDECDYLGIGYGLFRAFAWVAGGFVEVDKDGIYSVVKKEQ